MTNRRKKEENMTRGVGPIAAAGLDSKKVHYVIDLSPLCHQPIRAWH